MNREVTDLYEARVLSTLSNANQYNRKHVQIYRNTKKMPDNKKGDGRCLNKLQTVCTSILTRSHVQ